MNKLLELYQTLLEVYTDQVKGLENKKKEVEKEHRHIQWLPHRALNCRMFTYDEYLTNAYNGGFCYEEKNKVMPHLIYFLSSYEKCSDEERKNFESVKPKNEYQQYLDELYIGKGSLLTFLESQLKQLRDSELNTKVPYPPQRRNATRKITEYHEDKRKYEEEIEIINRCRQEVRERMHMFNDLLKKQD